MKRRYFPKAATLKRDGYKCQYCGKGTTQVDHIIPYSITLNHDPDNLVTCCGQCNRIAGAKFFPDFLAKKDYILGQRLKKQLAVTDPFQFPDLFPFIQECKHTSCEKLFDTRKSSSMFCSGRCEKLSLKNAKQEVGKRTQIKKSESMAMGEEREFVCKNCGRLHKTTHARKVFCNESCKNNYHSGSAEKIRRLEEDIANLFHRIEALEDRPIPQAEVGNGT